MALRQDFEFRAPSHTGDGTPIYMPGDLVQGTVTIYPEERANTRGVQLWIGCLIHGSGTSETIDLAPEHFIHEGDIEAGVPISASFGAPIPTDAPLSYQGRRIKFDWQVRLRVDIPIWPDKRYSVPFLVVPLRR